MQKEKFIPQIGFLALTNQGTLDGFLEDHLGGIRPEEAFRKDQYKHWWRLNTGDRAGCIQTLIEAHALGLLPGEREQFTRWWSLKDADAYEFAKKVKIALLISAGGYRASFLFKKANKSVFGIGITPFLAICNLWIVIKNMNDAPQAKK